MRLQLLGNHLDGRVFSHFLFNLIESVICRHKPLSFVNEHALDIIEVVVDALLDWIVLIHAFHSEQSAVKRLAHGFAHRFRNGIGFGKIAAPFR